MERHRRKLIEPRVFETVQRRIWTPVKVIREALPPFASAIPDFKLAAVYASGTFNSTECPYPRLSGHYLVGGYDVYRNDPKDDPYVINKDSYAVLYHPDDETWLFVDGPLPPDDEHWLVEIPARFKGVEVVGGNLPPGRPPFDYPWIAER